MLDAISRIVAAGKAAGILTMDPAMQRKCLDLGATFVATDIDVVLFAKAMRASAKQGLALLPDQTVSGTAKTDAASKYLQQLCKHWSHKAETSFDADKGQVSFPGGDRVDMTASADSLSITATTGPRGDLAQWQQVIEAHLVRFAFREEFKIDWAD